MKKSVLYSNAIVKTYEGKLLNAERVRRILNAADISEAVKVLYECDYNATLITQSHLDIDELLNDEMEKTVAFFQKMCADTNLITVIMRRYDYHNLKALLKQKYGEADIAESVYPFGGIGLEKLEQVLREEAYNELPPVMSEAAREIKKLFAAGEPSGKQIDITLDIAMLKETAAYVKKIKNIHIRQYFTGEADLKNILTAARMKAHGFTRDQLAAQLVQGGNLETAKLYKLFESAPENIPQIFVTTGYYSLIKELAVILSEGRPLSDFEVKAEEFLFGLSRVDKDNYFEANPLFAWYIQKLAEIKTVKLIFVCKKNNIGNDLIRLILKPIYK